MKRITEMARIFSWEQAVAQMKNRLTIKQKMFAKFMASAARGNQTLAARLARYKGDNRQLAVQGSVNMKNPQIQEMVDEMLDALVEPSLKTLEEGLKATKRRAFLTKTGDIVYTPPEPDHRVRTATAKGVLDLHQRTSNGYAAGPEVDVVSVHEDSAKPQKEVTVDTAKTEGCAGGTVAQLDPADRILFEQAAEIEAELADVDRELGDGDHGTDQ